ncbi:ABC transporter ATP-binding protein [Pusillimonas sp. ANT_WB101]|uniref:ABC transporter ATP-binding protein n=1 Tax=Pusillimonas sp. ANT_WB101 TaxID=2597356 RepID=UPI0011EE2433|nr:ABC transporter ATP-binding protein [Pusillimonas sp. ANT_WB101]KAA0892637.1 ABC transporter ATP-binding protein [Pusillimonas sp. ANT_WB101]
MSLLSVANLDASYGKGLVLNNVSIEVPKGKIVTVLGSNGAGKTTLLNVICGQLRGLSGSIVFDGEDISKIKQHEAAIKGMAVSPEGRKLFAEMTVYENLRMGGFVLPNYSKVRSQAAVVMELFPRIKERLNQRVSTMSGGEQQMVAIGRALMMEPKLLILDEPTLGLAPKLIVEIGKIIKNISDAGVSVLLVEQNAQLALRLADYGYVLETGVVRLEGPASDLLSNDEVRKVYLGA